MGCIGVNEMCFFKFMKWVEMSSFGESLVFILMHKQDWHFIKGIYFGLFFWCLKRSCAEREGKGERQGQGDQRQKERRWGFNGLHWYQ